MLRKEEELGWNDCRFQWTSGIPTSLTDAEPERSQQSHERSPRVGGMVDGHAEMKTDCGCTTETVRHVHLALVIGIEENAHVLRVCE